MDFPNDFLKPKLTKSVNLGDNCLEITIEPLEIGFGHTLGNALRRTMLSSMPGAAVVEAKMSGILHEFSLKEGIYEDVMDILLNLSDIKIKMEKRNAIELSLNKKGPCKIFASDFILPSDVEIMNPDRLIASIDKFGDLGLDIRILKGYGSKIASEKHDFSKKELLGWLQLDAFFSPINRISYKVQSTKFENRINLEKLILYIDTNGTITASDALHWSSKILCDQLSVFIDFNRITCKKKVVITNPINPMLLKPVDVLGLTVRSSNCLKNENIYYIGDLVQKSETDLLNINNFGKKSLVEINAALHNINLHFEYNIPDWEKIKCDHENKI